MRAKFGGAGRLVWVSCVPVGWPKSVTVEDSFGVPHELTTSGPYVIFEDAAGRGRLGLAAEWVRQVGAGVHLVRFEDGRELPVRLDSPYQWEHAGVAA